MIAVRQVTQQNQGKKTAGVDGVKALTPKSRLKLVSQIKVTRKAKAKPTRRVWIPKPGRDEKRPLGIPTIHDRALQGLVKQSLEPEWEAYMEVMHKDRSKIEKAQGVIEKWLREIGLELKAEKTRISHTLEGENPGFDFLGFNIRQYRVGKYQSGRNGHGTLLGFKTIIKPSDKSIRNHKEQLLQIVRRHKGAPQEAVIAKLNPVIRGWSNYFRTVVSKVTYSSMDKHLWELLWQWAKGRHPNKSGRWIARKYWALTGSDRWRFTGKTKGGDIVKLARYTETEIVGWGRAGNRFPTLP